MGVRANSTGISDKDAELHGRRSMLVSEKGLVHIRIRVVCKVLWDTSVSVPAEVAVSILDHPMFTPRRVIVTWSYTAQNYYRNTVLHLLFLTQSVSPFQKFVFQ